MSLTSYFTNASKSLAATSEDIASPLVCAVGLTRTYKRGSETVKAVDSIGFDLTRGEFAAIIGPSGAGKTTLLHLLGCMDLPTSGSLQIAGRNVCGLKDRDLTRLRRETVGFVFQHFGLLPTMTLVENVTLPTLFSRRKAASRAAELLDRVGLSHRINHLPNQLSGGEMQRAAIARALINEPSILLADEPTGNLDRASGERIIQMFEQLNSDGLTIVVVTHNPELAQVADRQMTLQDGKLVGDRRK